MSKFQIAEYKFDKSILFSGPTGVGKTYLSKKILQRYKNDSIRKGMWTYEISDGRFKQMVKSNMLVLRKPQEREASIEAYPLEMMLRVDVLLYDDIGVSDVSDAYLRDFTFIMDERIKKNKINIFTTNLTINELNNKLNERIVSRILMNTNVIGMQGEDRRLATTEYFTGLK